MHTGMHTPTGTKQKVTHHVCARSAEHNLPSGTTCLLLQDYKKMENWIKEAVDRIKQENVPQAKGVLIDLQADSVPEEYKVGKWGIWPMYAPGVLYQVKGEANFGRGNDCILELWASIYQSNPSLYQQAHPFIYLSEQSIPLSTSTSIYILAHPWTPIHAA